MSIRAKLLALTFVGMLALCLSLGGYFVSRLKADALSSSQARIELILEKQSNLAQQKLNRLISLLEGMLEVGDKIRFGLMLNSMEESQTTLTEYSLRALEADGEPAFPELVVVDDSGQVIVSSNPSEIRTQFLFVKGNGQTVSSQFLADSQTFQFAMPLNIEGELIGWLLAKTHPDLFAEIRKSLDKELRRYQFQNPSAEFFRTDTTSPQSFHEEENHFVAENLVVLPDSTYGSLRAKIPVDEVTGPIWKSVETSIKVALLVLILSFGGLSAMIYRIVIQPLMALRSGADKMASGDFNQVFTVARQDEIGELAHSFNRMSEAVLSSQGKLEDFIHRLEDMVQEKTASIQNLLDNAGQGFLSYDKNFVIQPEFSRECQHLFGEHFRSGARIDDFFFDNEAEREGFRSWLINAFEDKIDFDVIKELAPNQLKVGEKICSMEYRLLKIGDTRLLMTILTNITDRVRLERRVKEEQAFARMILKVLESKEEFSAFLEEFDVMSDNMKNWLKAPDRNEIVELFRKVHTIKGHAAAFDFVHLTESLHELESLMQDTRTSPPNEPIPAKQLNHSFDNVLEKMETLKGVLKDSLKDAVDWEQKRIQISEALLQRILAKVKDSDARLHDELLACVHKPLQAMLSQYPALVESLADRCGKLVHPVCVEGESVLVDPDRFKPLVRSLVHLFRNAVDHGIEDPEYRDSIGKDPYGTIKIEVLGNENGIMLKVSDDGAGICPNKVVQSVLKKGLKTKEQVDAMSIPDQQMLIFLPGFSTREVTTDLSGRGIGMDAVMAEIKALMGSIDVDSTVGQGTTFTIILPIQPET